MGAMLTVRGVRPDDVAACVAIVRGLTDYFTDDVPEKVAADAARHIGWVAADDDVVVGFAIVDRRGERVAEILWMAVDVARRGEGVGTLLLDRMLTSLARESVRVVEVKSLDGAADYAPYIGTRAFWERHGFVQIDTIDPLPGWQPGNPAAIYVAAIAPTRGDSCGPGRDPAAT